MLPSFVTFDSDTLAFTFLPTRFSHLGSFVIRLWLHDELTSTAYSFTVKVTNDPPILTEALKDQNVVIGIASTYVPASIYDPEGMEVETWIEFENGAGPDFVTYNKDDSSFTFLPTQESYINTQWTVLLYYTDNLSPALFASFKITVFEDVESMNAALLSQGGGGS